MPTPRMVTQVRQTTSPTNQPAPTGPQPEQGIVVESKGPIRYDVVFGGKRAECRSVIDAPIAVGDRVTVQKLAGKNTGFIISGHG